MAGYKAGKGFYLSNQDGSFSLMMSGQLQTRWVMNHNSGRTGDDANNSENEWGFQVRRAKVRFQGNVIDPSWTYQVNGAFEGTGDQFGGSFAGNVPTGNLGVDVAASGTYNGGTQGFSDGGGAFVFQEAFIAKELENGLTLTFGQFKSPWLREELVDSSQQLAVERSVVNEFFQQDRSVGIMASYATDSWNVAASYNNGQATAIGTSSTRYSDFTNNPTDWSFSGRFEYKFSGDWSDFDSFTSAPGDEEAIMVGVAFMGQKYGENAGALTGSGDYTVTVPGAPPTVTPGTWSLSQDLDGTTVWGLTADISAKFSGFSIFAAYIWQTYDPDGTTRFTDNTGAIGSFTVDAGDVDSYDPWGFVAQAGYSLNDQWEIFGRYSDGNVGDNFGFLVNADSGNPSILTLGANYFVNDNVKFTVDWGINFAEQMNFAASNPASNGWTSSDESDQWVLRAQLQLLF
jgi:phosphate-selective porin